MRLSAASMRIRNWMVATAIAAVLVLSLANRGFVTTHDPYPLPKLIPPNELAQARARLATYTPEPTDRGIALSLAVLVETDFGVVIASVGSLDSQEQIFDFGPLDGQEQIFDLRDRKSVV